MKWKKLALPGLGAAALGFAAVVLGRRRRKKSPPPTPIPDPVGSIFIETDPRPLTYRGRSFHSQSKYTCKPSRFRVWGLLDRPPAEDRPGGNPIYLVSPVVEFTADSGGEREVVPEERFYATLHYRPEGRMKSHPNAVGVGAPLEFRKCHVGGSMNGVETGDALVTAPVSNFKVTEPAGV